MAGRRVIRRLRWVALVIAVIVLGVFVGVQRQTVRVSYRDAPSVRVIEGSAGELSGASVPSVAAMTAMVRDNPVVRLPGAVAVWDEARVRAAIGTSGTRILVAPPGLDEATQKRVREVENATVRIIGTAVTGGIYQSSGSRITEWQRQYATGDVTTALVSLIDELAKRPEATGDAATSLTRREPTAAELATVLDGLRRTPDGIYVAPGATLTTKPLAGGPDAFGGVAPVVVALPRQTREEPMPRYGPALARALPAGTPVVTMYGDWIEYDGPHADAFAEVAAASFYAQFGDRISRFAHPQTSVLGTWLSRVADIRYAGLFDRPIPYVAYDPLRVALPVLPWIFVVCVLVFLGLSARLLARPPLRSGSAGQRARLAGLTALAVEMAPLTGSAALNRALTRLTAARDALDTEATAAQVQTLLNQATADLDEAARAMPFAGYRPADYLRGRLG